MLESDKLNLFDQYIRSLVQHFYFRPSLNGLRAELGSSDLFACTVLGRTGKCTMSELADQCGLAMSSTTGVVDRLVAIRVC